MENGRMAYYITHKCGKSDVFNGIINWHLSAAHLIRAFDCCLTGLMENHFTHINLFQTLILLVHSCPT